MNHSVTFKRVLLCSASIMIASGFCAGPAFAADPAATVSLSQTPNVLVDAGSIFQAQQDLAGPVTTNAAANQIVVTATAGTGGGVFSNSSEVISAIATGSTVTLNGSLSSLALPDGLAFGVLQFDSAIVRALSQSNVIGLTFDGLQTGNFSLSNNAVRSTTNLNTAAITASGSQALGYVSSSSQNGLALITGNEANRVVKAAGTVAMSVAQATSVDANGAGEDSGAIVGGAGAEKNTIFLSASSQTNTLLSAPLALSTNTLAATFTGNQLSVSPRILAVDTTLEGSISVANSQSYDGNSLSAQAINTGSTLTVAVSGTNNTVITLNNGSVAVSNNVLSATMTGNSATDSTIFGNGQSFSGPAATNKSTIELGSAAVLAGVSAEISNAASQYIGTIPGSVSLLAAKTADAAITASLQGVTGSQVTLGTNSVTAASTGNLLDVSVRTSAGSNIIDGSMALGSIQIADAAKITATLLNGRAELSIGVDDTAVLNSTIRVASNTSQARSTGQQATQVIGVTAVSIPLSSNTAKLTTDGFITGSDKAAYATGAAVIATYQNNLAAMVVTATNLDGIVSLDSEDATGNSGSSLAVTSNVQNSTAIADIASNSAILSATSAAYGVGLVNAQRLSDAGSAVAATTTSTISLDVARLGASSLATSAIADLTLNRTEAVAAGTSATNSVSVSSQSVSLVGQDALAIKVTYDAGASGGRVFSGGAVVPTVEAAFALLNEQTAEGTLTAVGATSVKFEAVGNVSGSSLIRNTGNTLTLQAQGAVSSNALTLSIPVVAQSAARAPIAPVAALANVQETGASASFSAAMLEANQIEILTRIGGDVSNSTLTQASNNLAAIADGNRTGNSLTVAATTIAAAEGTAIAPTAGRTSYLSGVVSLDAAFTVLNAQSAGAPNGSSSVVATLREQLDNSAKDGAQIVTEIGGNIDGSSISLTANVLRALANGNFAGTANAVGNSLTLNTASGQTTAALGNVQIANSDVLTSIGFAGSNFISANSGSSAAGGLSLNGSTLIVTQAVELTFVSPLTTRESNLLSSIGWSATAGLSTVQIAPGQYNVAGLGLTVDPGGAAGGDERLRVFALQALTGTLSDGGFLISTGTGISISNSILAMTGNTASGSSFANTASNALTVSAASIIADSTQIGASVYSRQTGLDVQADFALLNNQFVGPDVIARSLVANIFGITTGANSTITNSTINLSTNTQTSVATANYASNALTLTGATSDIGIGGPGAIGSRQSNASGGVTLATSAMDIIAPVAGTGDVVTISGNRNAAAATINDVRNTLAANGNALGTAGIVGQADLLSINPTLGDYVVSNVQRSVAQSSVTASATTQIYNQDFAYAGADTANRSTVAISNNVTAADAIANRASNTLTSTATGSQGASLALLNDQSNASAATAGAASAILLGLQSGTGSQIDGSAFTLASNSAIATAAGNTATNTMRLSGASLAPSQMGASGSLNSVEGQAAILNAQSNTGNITANSLGSVLNVLPGSSLDGTINNMSAVVSGTTIAANAAGNSNNSSITLVLLNSDNPSAVLSSMQSNTGSVTASVANTMLAVNAIGAPGSGNWQMTGSSISATAVGNSATLTITAQ